MTNPELFCFDQIEMGVNGGARERREELEEPGDELSGQLLGLDARIGHVDNPLIVLQILQQQKINTHKKVLENPRNQKPKKKRKKKRREGEWEIRGGDL